MRFEYPVMIDYDRGLGDRWREAARKHGAHRAEIHTTRPKHYNVLLFFKRVVPDSEVVEILKSAGADEGYIALVKQRGPGIRASERVEVTRNSRRAVPRMRLLRMEEMARVEQSEARVALTNGNEVTSVPKEDI